jgi:hypothetical protein
MTDQELAEIKARCDAVQHWPWKVIDSDRIMRDDTPDRINLFGVNGANKEFIEHSRDDVLKLHAEVMRLRALLESN